MEGKIITLGTTVGTGHMQGTQVAQEQVEAVELMIASNTITVAHAEALLKATPPEQRTDVKPAEREKRTAPIEQIEKLEREMSQVQEKY